MGIEISKKDLSNRNTMKKKKSLVKISPIRLVDEDGVEAIWGELC